MSIAFARWPSATSNFASMMIGRFSKSTLTNLLLARRGSVSAIAVARASGSCMNSIANRAATSSGIPTWRRLTPASETKCSLATLGRSVFAAMNASIRRPANQPGIRSTALWMNGSSFSMMSSPRWHAKSCSKSVSLVWRNGASRSPNHGSRIASFSFGISVSFVKLIKRG